MRARCIASGLAMGLLCCACGAAGPEGAASPGPVGSRIVVMAPAAAEMLDEFGLANRVVGVGDFVSETSLYANLPRVGAYNAPSVERILELRTDLFLTSASAAAATAHRRLESFGVRVVALDTSTYDGVLGAVSELGRLLDREAEAGKLGREMHDSLERVRRTADGLPERRVLFVVGRDPLYVAGPGSHVNEMIELVGGTNVVHDASAPYQRASMEAVLERMPEVIIDTSSNRQGAPRGRLRGDWGRWEFLPAVQQERVFWVDPSRLVIPGIRLPEMTTLMGKLIHPEAFGEASDAELTKR